MKLLSHHLLLHLCVLASGVEGLGQVEICSFRHFCSVVFGSPGHVIWERVFAVYLFLLLHQLRQAILAVLLEGLLGALVFLKHVSRTGHGRLDPFRG